MCAFAYYVYILQFIQIKPDILLKQTTLKNGTVNQ